MRPFWDLIFLSFYSLLVIVRRSLFHWAVTFNSSRQLSEQDLVGAFKCNIDYFVLKRAIGSSLSHDWQVGDLSSVDKLSSSTRSTNTMTLLKTFSLHLQMEYIRYMNNAVQVADRITEEPPWAITSRSFKATACLFKRPKSRLVRY